MPARRVFLSLEAIRQGARERALMWRLIRRSPYYRARNDIGVLFVHVPKAAGVSIKDVLGLPRPGHIPARVHRDYDPERFARYFVFGVCRNPWDRLLSTYRFLRDPPDGVSPLTREFAEACATAGELDSFSRFASAVERSPIIRGWAVMKPQAHYLCDTTGQILVDELLRFERLADEWARVATRIGAPSELPRLNVSRGDRAYRQHYTPATRRAVERVYARDIETFGYSF